ncbi:MAG: transposase [Verrucomicrobiaceae bacterium]|nr:transposase [Verrucomicrobiaceae bacterium]
MPAKPYQPAGYDSDLSDAEWELIKPIIYPAGAKRCRGRLRAPDSARICLDTIRYVLKTGSQWSMIPKNLAPRSTAHDALSKWTEQGLWPKLNDALRTQTRLMLKKRHAQRRCHRQPKRQRRAATGCEPAVTTRARRSGDASATRSPTPTACCWAWWSRPPTCKIVTAQSCCCACFAMAS